MDTLPAAIRDRINVDERGCWLWCGGMGRSGYGRWRGQAAHVAVWELLVGPLEQDLVLDHLCAGRCATLAEAKTRRPCVNPDHLEPVTQQENLLRGFTVNAYYASRTSCEFGHPFDEANTLRRKDGGRGCRACHAESMRRRRAGLPSLRTAGPPAGWLAELERLRQEALTTGAAR